MFVLNVEKIPQPSSSAYERGDQVCVYVSDDDVDSEFHGEVCRVVERFQDGLAEETGRELDAFSYRVECDGNVLPVTFRHFDLVPHPPR